MGPHAGSDVPCRSQVLNESIQTCRKALYDIVTPPDFVTPVTTSMALSNYQHHDVLFLCSYTFCVHTCFVLLNLLVLENVAFLREACIMRSNKNVSGAGKKDDVLFDRQCIIKMPAFLVYDGSTHQQQRIGVWYEDFRIVCYHVF